MSFAEKDLILKMDTEASSNIETGVDKGHKGFHMHNMTCQKRVKPLLRPFMVGSQ